MYCTLFRHDKRSLVIRALFFCGLLAGGLAAQSPYAVEPDWWDAAVKAVSLMEEKDLVSTYARTRDQALEKFKVPQEPWWIIGPFSANSGLDSQNPPEQNPRRVANSQHKSKDGNPVKWVSLEDNRKEFRHNNAIYYLSSMFSLNTAGPVWLVPEHNHGMALWVDGRPTYFQSTPPQRSFQEAIRMTLSQGTHETFIKLYQDNGNGSAEVGIYRADPRFVEIMALILSLTDPKYRDDLQWYDLANRLSERFAQVEDYTNAMHWQRQRFPRLGKMEREELFQWIQELLNENPEASSSVQEFYQQIYKEDGNSDQVQVEIMLAHLDLVEGDKDPQALRKLLMAYDEDLMKMDPVENELRWTGLLIMEGDVNAAGRRLREVVEQNPALSRNDRIKKMNQKLEELRQNVGLLPLDWDFDGTVRQAERLAQSDPGGLNRFIRSVLRDKGGSMIRTKDPNLFLGVHSKYQQAFSPHADVYQPALKEYVDLLTRQLDLTPEQRQQQIRRLSLDPPPPPAFSLSLPEVNTFRLPPTRGVRPLLELDPGSRELSMEVSPFRDTFQRPAPASADADSSGFVLQNSRSVAAFRQGRLLWRRVWEPSTLNLEEDRTPLHGSLRPAMTGTRIFARILRDGQYALMALDRSTGKTLWAFTKKDRVLCTNPVIWDGQVLTVTRSKEQIAQYALVFFNQHSGKVQKELPLVIGPYWHDFNRFGGSIEPDHYMPDPVLAGETLFIQTNSGIISAVDLPARATRWSRRYSDGAWNQYPQILKMRDRWTHSPTVVNGVAVFGPMDSISLLAVDAASGELLAQNDSIDWISVHPFGKRLLLIDREGQALIIDPQTLNTLGKLPGKNYRALQDLEGGVVLEQKGTLEVWSASPLKLRERQTVPSGWQAFQVEKQSVFLYQPESIRPVVALGTPIAGVNGKPVPPSGDLNLSRIRDGFFRRGENAIYLVGKAAVQKWTNPEKPDWTVPTVFTNDLENVCVLEGGSLVYLVGQNRIWVVDATTGEVLNRYPRTGDDWSNIHGAAIEDNILLFSTDKGEREYEVMLMRGTDIRSVGTLNDSQGTPIVIAKLGNHIVTKTRDELLELQKKTDEDTWKIKNKVRFENAHRRKFRIGDNGRRIYTQSDMAVVIDPDASIYSHKTHNWGRKYYRQRPVYDEARVSKGLLTWKTQSDAWNVFSLDTSRDLSKALNSDTRPIMVEGKAIGLEFDRNGRARRLTPHRVNPKNGKDSPAPEIDFSDVLHDWRDISTERLVFERDGDVYTLLDLRGEVNDQDENFMVIFNPENGQSVIHGFPDIGEVRDSIVWKDHLWITREQDVLILSFNEIDQLTEGTQLIAAPRPLPKAFQVDGTPAEWGPEAMGDTESDVFAYVDNNQLVLAGTIRNPAFIRSLGREGFDERVILHLRNGPAASFVFNKGLDLPTSELVAEAEAAYTVHPSGDHMFYEITLPSPTIKERGFSPLRNHPARKLRGDFAFDLSITRSDGHRVFAHSERPWPVWFPRFYLKEVNP